MFVDDKKKWDKSILNEYYTHYNLKINYILTINVYICSQCIWSDSYFSKKNKSTQPHPYTHTQCSRVLNQHRSRGNWLRQCFSNFSTVHGTWVYLKSYKVLETQKSTATHNLRTTGLRRVFENQRKDKKFQ